MSPVAQKTGTHPSEKTSTLHLGSRSVARPYTPVVGDSGREGRWWGCGRGLRTCMDRSRSQEDAYAAPFSHTDVRVIDAGRGAREYEGVVPGGGRAAAEFDRGEERDGSNVSAMLRPAATPRWIERTPLAFA